MVDPDSFNARLDRAIAAEGIDNAEFARRIDPVTGQANVTNWRKRGRLGGQSHAKVRAALPKASIEWINDGVGSPPELAASRPGVEPEAAEDVCDIRGVRQGAALGDGALHDEYAETHKLKFRASSLVRKGLRRDNLIVYYGQGDSMLPRIHDGDALMFDLSDRRPVDGRIYLFSCPDTGLTVKRLADYGGRWFLEAENKSERNWTKPVPMVDDRQEYVIEGRLRWIGSWED